MMKASATGLETSASMPHLDPTLFAQSDVDGKVRGQFGLGLNQRGGNGPS